MRVVLNTTLLRKYTGRTSNTVTIVKERFHEDCIKSKLSTTIIMIKFYPSYKNKMEIQTFKLKMQIKTIKSKKTNLVILD